MDRGGRERRSGEPGARAADGDHLWFGPRPGSRPDEPPAADDACPPAEARAVVLPLPYERTTSYGRGTAGGPEALLRASHFLEIYDDELGLEPLRQGVATLPPLVPRAAELGAAIGEIEDAVRERLAADQFVIALGGEHSLTVGAVRAAKSLVPELGVVQFDAHADLRDRYEGTGYSHACVMRRVLELGVPAVTLGLRAIAPLEAELIREGALGVIWADELPDAGEGLERLLADLPESVYLTFDLDFFDPSLVPATGTPEPGGGTWFQALRLLRQVFERKRVVAMDVVELAPVPGQPGSDFIAAKLVLKALGYHALASGLAGEGRPG